MKVLHIKEYSAHNSGPHIRKCTECGVRLWVSSDGHWTEERETFEKPPKGFINCAEAKRLNTN